MSESLGKIKAPRLEGLIALANAIAETESDLRRKNYIKGKYNRTATEFDISLDYFELLGFVRIDEERIHVSGILKKLIHGETGLTQGVFERLVVDSLLSGGPRSSFLGRFIALFQETSQGIILDCPLGDRLRYSDLRNLFLELEVIEYDTSTDLYKVAAPFVEHFLSIATTSRRPPIDEEELVAQLEAQKRLGADAELLVIQYERERLAEAPNLLAKIEHTAKTNVGAGYDILSWEVGGVKRYIEVKAVSPTDMRFYWSTNEIGVAHKYSDRYFLYLIPAVSEKINLNAMQIIQNPHEEVFLNKKSWTKASQIYTIWKDRSNETTSNN